MSDLVPEGSRDVAIPKKAQWLLEEGIADNTRRAQRSDARYVAAWQKARFAEASFPLSVGEVKLFITDHLAGLEEELDQALVDAGVKAKRGPHKWSTVSRRLATLAKLHQAANLEDPTKAPEVAELLQRSRKALAKRGGRTTKKKAATREVLDALLRACDGDDLLSVRDRAILLFGAASGGRRRSEIAEAQFEDLEEIATGYLFRPQITKTAQAGEDKAFPLVGRAAQALGEWLRVTGIESGPLFRSIGRGKVPRSLPLSGQDIGNLIQRRAEQAGYDGREFGGHSLRRGFITEAGRQGLPLGAVMALSGHRSVAIAMGYYEAGAAETSPASRVFE